MSTKNKAKTDNEVYEKKIKRKNDKITTLNEEMKNTREQVQ